MITRRRFVTISAVAACACVAVSGLPSVEAAPAADAKAAGVDIGTPADFARDGVVDKFARSERFILVRSKGKLHAVSSICTHQPVPLRVQGDVLFCPEHRATFGTDGSIVDSARGKVKRPLVRYGVELGADGRLRVDKSKTFTQASWNDKGAFVEIKAGA